ncbi:lipoxygenase 6, chloroplastic isoform X2 [Ipomoea triloba]|uniref:lipoxygenase 6, chloroplastic isoform X2 n=1 Tax=Ipomoea triloba TaxID=35885 RepID=UPI00125E0248|nr:lipoxygenase 6, chloroplastic isoform X2 [Ipomoea triloba]
MLTAQPRTTTFCSNIQHVLNLRRPDAISGTGRNDRARRRATPFPGLRRPIIQAVVRGGDSKATVEEAAGKVMEKGLEGLMQSGTSIDVRAVITIRKKMRERLVDKIEDQWISFINGIGRGILIQLISEEIDPVTQSGKSSEWSYVRGFPKTSENNPYIVEYAADLRVPRDFGCPGAALITNFLDREVYLVQIVVHGFSQGPLFFSANTWIHSSKDNPTESRIIFKNQAYLPSQTPLGIKGLRSADLMSIRGNGKGERKLYERIYDYEVYNDLGNPDKDEDLARPVLGGKEWPYPRRCRTGRLATKTDPATETRIEKPNPVYVPRDEAFGEIKQDTFSAGKLKAALHNLIPLIASTLSSSDIPFNCFSDIDKLYIDGFLLKDGEEAKANIFSPNMMTQLFSAGKGLFKYEIPAVIKTDRFSWLRDDEFARQALAGVNPVNIELLKEVPILSKLDPAIYGPPESAITKDIIEKQLTGMTVEEAIAQKRLFIIDYHDMLLPFMEKMNSLAGKKAYATRTIFLYTPSATLMPIIIELSLPHRNKRVLTHDSDATSYWIWKQAKAHVCSNDAGVHQLVNHWLRTHASMEPYIIATQRQLSSMHPIYKLLRPHMRYTMEINALARQSLINGGGIIEACFSPGKYSMEISSAAYKTMWRFDMEALPADLVRRLYYIRH